MSHGSALQVSLSLRLSIPEDLEGWLEFAELSRPLVYRMAVRRGFHHSNAADLVQDVLMRLPELQKAGLQPLIEVLLAIGCIASLVCGRTWSSGSRKSARLSS